MHRRISQYISIAAIAMFLTVCGLAACSDSANPTETGTLRVLLMDAPTPLQDVDSLMVVFDEVLVHRSSGAEPSDDGWFVVLSDTLPVEERTFDLMQLVNGVFATLGDVELDAGRYTQIRIMLESARVVVDGVSHEVTIPSGFQTGIKLVGGFTIEPNVITEIAADFDVARSLHESPPGSGNYILRPTIRLVQTTLSGSISGSVLPVGIGAALFALEPATGDTVATTLTDPATGAYVLPALLAGVYDVRAGAAGYQDSTKTGVTVTAGADTPHIDFDLVPSSD